MAYVKTIEVELKGISTLAANLNAVSSVLDVSNKNTATIFIDHARDEATAFVGAGTEYRVQISEQVTGNNTWRTLYSVVCDITAASSIVMDAQEAAGSTQIETGATLPAVGDMVFFKNATLANSEWSRVISIVTTGGSESFTILDGLTNIQPAITLFNKAEQFVLSLNVRGATRLRVVANNNNGTTNKNIVWRCAVITE